MGDPARTWGAAQAESVAPPPDAEYETFTYFDTEVRVVADPLSLTLTLEEFMDIAATLEQADMRAVGAVRGFLRAMIHPEDFNAFWRTVREQRQGIEQQMAFGKWLVEEITQRPTERQSDSSDGLPQTEPSSMADASWAGYKRRFEEQGRPDLAMVVLEAHEYREQMAASAG